MFLPSEFTDKPPEFGKLKQHGCCLTSISRAFQRMGDYFHRVEPTRSKYFFFDTGNNSILNHEVASEKSLVKAKDEDRKERIEFLTSAFMINASQGSTDSVEWLNALADVSNLDVFRSDITLFIDMQWEMSHQPVFCFGLNNIAYSIMLIADSNTGGSSLMKIICIIYSCLMLTFEGF